MQGQRAQVDLMIPKRMRCQKKADRLERKSSEEDMFDFPIEGEGVRTVHDNVHTARVEDVLIDSPEALPLLVVSLHRFAIA